MSGEPETRATGGSSSTDTGSTTKAAQPAALAMRCASGAPRFDACWCTGRCKAKSTSPSSTAMTPAGTGDSMPPRPATAASLTPPGIASRKDWTAAARKGSCAAMLSKPAMTVSSWSIVSSSTGRTSAPCGRKRPMRVVVVPGLIVRMSDFGMVSPRSCRMS